MTRRIAINFFNNLRVEIHNNKNIGASVPAQQEVDARLNSLGTVFLNNFLRLFAENNGRMKTNENRLTKKDKDSFFLFHRRFLYFDPI